MSDISITLPDGSARQVATGTTVGGLAESIGRGLAKAAVIGVVNGVERDLAHPLDDGDEVAIVTKTDARGLFTIRHSTAHVLAQAVLDLFPGATFGIGPVIEDGFYYDFQLPTGADGKPATFAPEDLPRIEARMREIIAETQPFVRVDIDNDRAREVFADHPFKLEIIDGEAEDPTSVTETGVARTYENPPRQPKERPPFRGYPGFIDLCRGPHVPDTKAHLGHFALTRIAGAYWRGDESKPQLQRIYGTAWASKADLDAHRERLEQAALRDHRKLGAELDLFSFPDEIGSGLAVFHPKGGLVRKLMEDYSRRRHEAGGYEFVYSPHIAKADLFKVSGHLQWYADGMFPPMHFADEGGAEGVDYYAKPMNCPFHSLIFRSGLKSYRDLPLRLFEFGSVYRYEKSGVIHGLTRVRGMTQDDSHIYCTKEQMGEELASLLDFVLGLLRDYGLDDFYLELSTKDDSPKFVGSDEDWEEATELLRQAAEGSGLELVPDPGGAAFYGPKISVQARDAIGRTWQMSTIQVDFQTPGRFGLEYVGKDGQRHTPVMIHRALFGSVERFFGVLLEHYAGAFPTWLAPVQVRLLPVRDDHMAYADRIADRLRAEGFRADVVDATEKLGNRIRKAKDEKLPYVLVVGDDDVAAGTVGVNPRGGEVERGVSVDDFEERLRVEVLAQTGGR